MNADGSGLANISNSRTDERHPNWSPDGSRLVVERADGDRDIVLMNPDGTNAVNITNAPDAKQ